MTIQDAKTVLPCMCVTYEATAFHDPNKLKAFLSEFNYRVVSRHTAHGVATYCRRIQAFAKADGRALTHDEQLIIAMGRAMVIYIRGEILGVLTAEDKDAGF